MKTFRLFVYVLIGLLLVLLGTQLDKLLNFTSTHSTVQSEVILNRIDKVLKLVTVEGHFTELYERSEGKSTTLWQFSEFVPFMQRKAIIRVQGNVSMGYDLEKMHIVVDEEKKKVILTHNPKPEILSIEHDLDYYDVYEGAFYKFSEDDFNKMNRDAKEVIRSAAIESDLGEAAQGQLEEFMEYLRFMVEKDGWEMEIVDSISPEPSELLS